jgi:hypothetical protein
MNTSWCCVTSYFRDLASAPKVRWRARAGASALEQEPKLLPESSRVSVGLLEFNQGFNRV